MKILLLTASFFKEGAVAKYAVELSQRLVKNHEVHVLTSRVGVDIEGVQIHKYPIPWWPYYLHVGSNAIKNTLLAKRLNGRYRFDVVHSQGGESLYQNIIKAPSCHRAAVDKFMAERGSAYRLAKRFEPASNIVLAIERYNYTRRNFKKAIVLSKGTYKELQHYYGVPDEYLKLIPNGVNIDEFKPDNRKLFREEVRKAHGLSESDTVLLFVGWEFKRKGLKHVIDALPRLPKDVKLLVVGGDDRSQYMSQAAQLGVSDRVVYAGHSKDVKRYYASADLFLLPTDYESFSMATLEAAASGLPVIATEVNGTEELIAPGVNGYFIERDGADIALKVQSALDGGRIRQMSAAARDSALPHSWDIIAKRTEDLYKELFEK
jgi:UDP-glucose:(heptosyl)LPS alpha-1,3-glucosyltransferase